MNKREQLYYVLTEYIAGHYDTNTFCYTFYDIFYPNIPKEELSKLEYTEFNALANAVARFSPYTKDIVNDPNAFTSKKDIQRIAKKAYDRLISG